MIRMDIQPNNHQSKHDRSRTKWTASLDKIFVDLVLEQVLQGNRSNNTFNKNAWEYIREEFNKQAGVEFNRKQLKKHLDVLRNRFLNVKSHFDQSGFGGDEPRHMTLPMIGDEVWEDYIEAYPVGEPTKIKDCPIYEQLCQIFSESESGIGRYAQSSHYIELDKENLEMSTPLSHAFPKTATMDPVTPSTATVDPVTPSTFLQDDSSSRSGEDINLDAQKKRKSSTASSGRGLGRGRPRKNAYHVFDESIADAMLEMATASKLRADALIHSCDQFSITKCVELLDQMSGLDEGFYLNVLDLFEDPVLREIFVSLKNDKRLIWLQGKCIFAGSTM